MTRAIASYDRTPTWVEAPAGLKRTHRTKLFFVLGYMRIRVLCF